MSERAQKRAEDAEIPPWPTIVTRERQQRYHDAADIPAGLFGDFVDPSILTNDTILAKGYMKKQGQEGLHAGQRIIQREPIHFDEPLTLIGRNLSNQQISKGHLVTTRYDFTRPNGDIPMSSDNLSFVPDPVAMKAKGGGATGKRVDDFTPVLRCDLTPEKVGGYSFEFPTYLIHFEPEATAKLGLRAPIAQGLMSLTWMTAAIAMAGPFRALDLEAKFRQPIFWDDRIELRQDSHGHFAVTNQDGEVCSMGTLHEVERV